MNYSRLDNLLPESVTNVPFTARIELPLFAIANDRVSGQKETGSTT